VEYPSFTKPANWRDLEVPDVLLSGNHAAIAKWRSEAALKRAQDNL
jgi:tRNA (guanine37-N1)-methyltransferase